VAVGSAILTAGVIAVFASGPATPPPAIAAGTSSFTTMITPSATAVLTARPSASSTSDVRAVIQTQVDAGGLDADAAAQLTSSLDEVDHDLQRGRTNQAAQRLSDLSSRLDQLHNDGRVTDAAYTAIAAAIQELAGALPASNQNN
jgi:serine/threonine-protein kinase